MPRKTKTLRRRIEMLQGDLHKLIMHLETVKMLAYDIEQLGKQR